MSCRPAKVHTCLTIATHCLAILDMPLQSHVMSSDSSTCGPYNSKTRLAMLDMPLAQTLQFTLGCGVSTTNPSMIDMPLAQMRRARAGDEPFGNFDGGSGQQNLCWVAGAFSCVRIVSRKAFGWYLDLPLAVGSCIFQALSENNCSRRALYVSHALQAFCFPAKHLDIVWGTSNVWICYSSYIDFMHATLTCLYAVL